MFTREDWTLFRTLGTLCQKAGVPPEHLRRLVAKELIDNAFDVVEAHGGGDVRADVLDDGAMLVEDTGPGIAGGPTDIADLFSIKRPLISSKLLRLPTRGALGNGLRVVAGAVLASGGRLDVWTRNCHLILTPQDSGETHVSWEPADHPVGTRILVRLGDGVPADHDLRTWFQLVMLLATGHSTYRGKTSPHWYDTDSFFEVLQAAGERTVRALVADLDGCAGARAGQIATLFKNRTCASLSRSEATVLLRAARQAAPLVKPERLGYVGPMEGTLGLAYARDTGLVELASGRGGESAVLPYTVEAWAVRGGDGTADTLQMFVNRTPITGTVDVQRLRERTDVGLFGCELQHRVKVGRAPLQAYLHVQTPYMPITSDGKAPDFSPFVDDIVKTLERVAQRATRQQPRTPAVRLTQKDTILVNLDEAVAKVSGGGAYRYSLRQLFYAVRPYLLQDHGRDPDYDYFAKVITDYEAEVGELPGIYRDARGTLYHPHLHEHIPLGTLAVEEYETPPWTFNKILYSEKEGFFSILETIAWPERYDCALLTSKGFASRAARDVLDLIAETDQEILFFCVHDADGPGTMIYQALQEATRARPGRKVKIINLDTGGEFVTMGPSAARTGKAWSARVASRPATPPRARR